MFPDDQPMAAHARREPSLEERENLLILLDYKAMIRSRTKVLKSLSNRPRGCKCMGSNGMASWTMGSSHY